MSAGSCRDDPDSCPARPTESANFCNGEDPHRGRPRGGLGRGDIVGKPIAIMLMQRGRGGNATVTVCHGHTKDLACLTRQADILIVAIGKAKFVTANMVKPGATVINVGINRTETGLVGDVNSKRSAKWPDRSRLCPAASAR